MNMPTGDECRRKWNEEAKHHMHVPSLPLSDDAAVESTDDESLTDDQYLRFRVLVPFYVAMESKRQQEAGNLTKQSAHLIYGEAIEDIQAHYAKKLELAELKARRDEQRAVTEWLADAEHVETIRDLNNLRLLKLNAQIATLEAGDA